MDVSAYLQDSAPLTFDMRAYESGTATARLHDPALVYTAEVGQQFDIWKDGVHIFSGSVDTATETRYATGSAPRYQDLTAVGQALILSRRFVRPGFYYPFANPYFYNKTPREILVALVTDQLADEAIALAVDGGTSDGSAHFPCTYSGLKFTYVSTPLVTLQNDQAVRIASYPADAWYVANATATDFELTARLKPATPSTDFTGLVSGTLDVLTVLDRVSYSFIRFSDLLDSLAAFSRSATGVGGYAWWVDETPELHFAPAAANAAPFGLTDSSGNFRNMSVQGSRVDYRNSQLVRCSYDAFTSDSSTFTGDGATAAFDTTAMLARVDGVTVNGTAKTVGILNQDDGKDWYYSPGDTFVSQDPAGAVLDVTDTIVVMWHRMGEDVSAYTDLAEVVARGTIEANSGLYQDMLDISNSADGLGAIRLAFALEQQYGKIPEIIDYETDVDGLRPGQYQSIVVSAFGLNANFLITTVTAQAVGTKFFRYAVELIGQVNKKVTAVDIFKSLAAGGSSESVVIAGGGGPPVSTPGQIHAVVVAPGAIDIGAAINAAYAGLPAEGGEIILDQGGSYSTPIVFDTPGKVAILRGFGNAVELTFTPTSGIAILFNNGPNFDFSSALNNIALTGSGNTHSAVGLQLGGANGAIGFTAANFRIQSFGVNVKTASNTWITKFSQGIIRDGGTNLLMPSGQTNAGENVEFDHVTFADAPTPHTNSVWVQGGGQEVIFSSCSFDQAQVRIGNGGTSAAQVCLSRCHFENPNFAAGGAVDYTFLVVDANSGNYVRLTDCFIEQDRSAGGNYTAFFALNGGVVNIIGLGMFTPATLTNFAVLAGAVNVNLFAFNDLSGNISGALFSGATTGFINSFPGSNTGASSGFNSIVGPGDLLGTRFMQFGGSVAVGHASAGLEKDLWANGNLTVYQGTSLTGTLTLNDEIFSTLGSPIARFRTDVAVGKVGFPQQFDVIGPAIVTGTLSVQGIGDLLTKINSLQAQITTLQADYNAHEHTAGTLTAPGGGGAVTGKTGTTDTPD